MQEGSPSPTALRVAVLRALHQTIDVPPVFVDPLAERILGTRRAELLATYRASAQDTLRLRGTLAARTLVAEDAIAEAVARGVRQAVILGAGLDTFAYRHEHDGLIVYEVDHPNMQAWKRTLLREGEIAIPQTLRFVSLDFENGGLFRELATTDFDPARPAILAMLGVSFYLKRATMFDLLQAMKTSCADGSEFVFDYTEPYDDAPEPVRAAYAAVQVRAAAGGEPWQSLYRPAEIHGVLQDRGFAIAADLDASDLRRRFLDGRTDGLEIAALLHLLRARL